jgi:hypothetical protein
LGGIKAINTLTHHKVISTDSCEALNKEILYNKKALLFLYSSDKIILALNNSDPYEEYSGDDELEEHWWNINKSLLQEYAECWEKLKLCVKHGDYIDKVNLEYISLEDLEWVAARTSYTTSRTPLLLKVYDYEFVTDSME